MVEHETNSFMKSVIMEFNNKKEITGVFFLIVLFFVLNFQGHPKILGLWEGSVIYNIFNPSKLPNLFPIIQKGADSVGFHGFMYNMLAVARIIADCFGHSISIIKTLPLVNCFITLFLLYIVVRRWFGWVAALVSVSLLMTNQYFLIVSEELVSSSILAIMLLLFVIERYQKLEMKSTKWTIISFAFVCAVAATNYIVVRLLMLSIIFYYIIDKEKLINNGFSLRNLTNKNKLRTTGFVLLLMVCFLSIFHPLNLVYLFNSNFIFPMTGEYVNNPSGILSSIYYNSLYIWKFFICDNSSNIHSSDLFVDIPYPLESIIIFALTVAGIIYAIINIRDNKYIFLLYLTGLLIGLVHISNLVPGYQTVSLEISTTLNHYRMFPLILFITIFAIVGIGWMSQSLRRYNNTITYIFYCCISMIILFRINAYVNEKQRFNSLIDEFQFDVAQPAISKMNSVNSKGVRLDRMIFDQRKDFHKNQIYFYKLAEYIHEKVRSSGEDSGIIYLDPTYYTPDYYRMGGGDVPWKGHPYYFQMYLTFYLQEMGLKNSYMVRKNDVGPTFFFYKLTKIIRIVDRYKRGENLPDQIPSNEKQKQQVILADNIINIIKYFEFGKQFIKYLVRDEHYYNRAKKYGDYYVNVTGWQDPEYIIVTSKDELSALVNEDKFKMVIDLSNDS